MFRDKARLLGFAPENGMLVLAYGRATLYERDGAFQLYCDYMRPFGAGAAQMAFDALKKKLSAEGLFDADHNVRCRLCRSVSGWSHPKPVRHCRM